MESRRNMPIPGSTFCPTCKEPAILRAKNFHRTSYCQNDHTWHHCAIHHSEVIAGKEPTLTSSIKCHCRLQKPQKEDDAPPYPSSSITTVSQVERDLVQICFELVLTATDDRNLQFFQGKSNDEKAAWVRQKLLDCGFETTPVGMNYGHLLHINRKNR